MKKQLCAMVSIGVLVVTSMVSQGMACTCSEKSVQDRLHDSEIVFAGKAISRKKALFNREGSVQVDFSVERFWKGKYKPSIFVFTGPTADIWGEDYLDMCALNFQLGERYVVFVSSKKQPYVDICSGTRDFPDAEQVIKELGKKQFKKK